MIRRATPGAGWLGISVLTAVAALHLDHLGFSPSTYLRTEQACVLFLAVQLAGLSWLLPLALAGRAEAGGGRRRDALARLALWLVPSAPLAVLLGQVSSVGGLDLARGFALLASAGLVGCRFGVAGGRWVRSYLAVVLAWGLGGPILTYAAREFGGRGMLQTAGWTPFGAMVMLLRGDVDTRIADPALLLALVAAMGIFAAGRTTRPTARGTGALVAGLVAVASVSIGWSTDGPPTPRDIDSWAGSATLEAMHPFEGWARPHACTAVGWQVVAGPSGYRGWVEARADGGGSTVRRELHLPPGGRRSAVWVLYAGELPTRIVVEAPGTDVRSVRLRPPPDDERLIAAIGLPAPAAGRIERALRRALSGDAVPRIVPIDPSAWPPSAVAFEVFDLLAVGADSLGADGPAEVRSALDAAVPWVAFASESMEAMRRRGLVVEPWPDGTFRLGIDGASGIALDLSTLESPGTLAPLVSVLRKPGPRLRRGLVPSEPEFGIRVREEWTGPAVPALCGWVLLAGVAQGFGLFVWRRCPWRRGFVVAGVSALLVVFFGCLDLVPSPVGAFSGTVALANADAASVEFVERIRLVGLGSGEVAVRVPRAATATLLPGKGEGTTVGGVPWFDDDKGFRAEIRVERGGVRTIETRSVAALPSRLAPRANSPGLRSPLPFALQRAVWIREGTRIELGTVEGGERLSIEGRTHEDAAAARDSRGWEAVLLERAGRWASNLRTEEGILFGVAAPTEIASLESKVAVREHAPTVWIVRLTVP